MGAGAVPGLVSDWFGGIYLINAVGMVEVERD